jgi:hypothetical protein
MNDPAIYTSKRTGKNLWQEYRVYRDRLELQCWILFHTVIIPANEIVEITIHPPRTIWCLKLDHCNFCRHVLLEKKSGLFKHIAFTPDDPEKFAAACRSIMTKTA